MNFELAVATSVVIAAVILCPFVVGSGGRLQITASVDSVSQLQALREAILKKFLEEEQAHQQQDISSYAWERRRNFLVNRYIDISHRLDFLMGKNTGKKS